jgi:glycogen operon protein
MAMLSPNASTPQPLSHSEYWFRDHPLVIWRGSPLPLGASITPEGINFSLVCRHGTSVSLVLMEPCNSEIEAELPLDPLLNHTGDHWHLRIDGLPETFAYGYRVDGPRGNGHLYDPTVILHDPSTRALSCGRRWGQRGSLPRRSLVIDPVVDRERSVSPRTPLEDTIIYELHVRGYTVDPSSGVRHPGTYEGLAEKIEYLKELGITAVELLPVDEFDEDDCPFVNPLNGAKLRNFWGYNPIAFSAPKAAYSVDVERSGPWIEFCAMVDAFHAHGIEVILDVVFNHTAEGGRNGTTYHFRGLDNALYYMLDDQGRYLNYTGCGNTVNTNHPVVRQFVLNSLRNWVSEAGIDGFRFDLASILGRDRSGKVLTDPPVVDRISEDSLLRDAKLIAEPWDAAGLYQVGTFPGKGRWSDWNGRYRDDVRRFWRGDPGQVSVLATRLCGSDDLYYDRGPLHSINFICCHDGFTLHDLVSYNHKHNEANGEGNNDGHNDNCSWNCGQEGPTTDPRILALRRRQARNLMATLLISQGVPMILGGDEVLRTQNGNNNAYCQDNATSWMDWTLEETNADFLRFVRGMIALRKAHPVFRRKTFFRGSVDGQPPEILWHGVDPAYPDFSAYSRSIAFALDGRRCDRPGVTDRDFYVAMNAYYQDLVFKVPSSPSGRRWRRVVDTALAAPEDILEPDEGPLVQVLDAYPVRAHSMIILMSEA